MPSLSITPHHCCTIPTMIQCGDFTQGCEYQEAATFEVHLEGWLLAAFIVIYVYFKISFTSLNICDQTLGVEGSSCCPKIGNKIEGECIFLKIEEG